MKTNPHMKYLNSLRAPNTVPWTILRTCKGTALGIFCISSMAAGQYTAVKRNRQTVKIKKLQDLHYLGALKV
jgi:hypothetical protein